MPSPSDYFLIGHSHVGAIMGAVRSEPAMLAPDAMGCIALMHAEFQPLVIDGKLAPQLEHAISLMLDEGKRATEGCRATVDRPLQFDPSLPIYSSIGGSAHNIMALVAHPRPFDFVLPGEEALPIDPTAERLPLAQVRDSLADRMEKPLRLLELVRDIVDRPMIHLESPPPIGDDDYISANLDAHYTDNAAEHPVPAFKPLRYKMARLHSMLMREECERLGIAFVSAPGGDAAGFLPADLAGNATHGNTAYGKLVVEQIKATRA